MDIDQLRYFVTAAETLNFTEAARRHFISQPAVSSQISALERSLKVKLFRRSSQTTVFRGEDECVLISLASAFRLSPELKLLEGK